MPSSPEGRNNIAALIARLGITSENARRLAALVRRPKYLIVAVAVVALGAGLVLLLQGYDYEQYERREQQYATNSGQGSGHIAQSTGGTQVDAGSAPTPPVAVNAIANRFCRALAPEGWMINDQDDAGAVFGITSVDGRLSAAYGNLGVAGAMRGGGNALIARLHQIAPYLAPPPVSNEDMGTQYQDPVTIVKYVIQQIAGNDVQFDGAPDPSAQNYQLLRFSSATKKGVVVFRTFTDYQQNESVVTRIATVDPAASDGDLAIAAAVATSISCRQALKPPPPPPSSSYQREKPAEDSTSPKCQVWSPNCDDSDFAGTYNAQLGTGYVHSESGHNYLRDPDTQKWENGPDGPGYYIPHNNGNWEKLQPGYVDPD